MPCESCQTQFTVFRRKRSCSDCKRFYCSGCLSARKRSNQHISAPLCERCALFAKRPLLKSDLIQMKPKDLIFYLQSKHISTAGCVEKDELITLILNYVQQADAASPAKSSRSDADTSNTFDDFKQSCQNFFSNISDNINDSIATFEEKNISKKNSDNSSNTSEHPSNGPNHIFRQPTVSRREIPTYSSFQSTLTDNAQDTATFSESAQTNGDRNAEGNPWMDTPVNETTNTERRSIRNNIPSSGDIFKPSAHDSHPCNGKVNLLTTKKESSESSFEELGAIGGVSDNSKGATDSNSSNMDQWQMFDIQQMEEFRSTVEEKGNTDNISSEEQLQVALCSSQQLPPQPQVVSQCVRKPLRRRSDGYYCCRRHSLSRHNDDDPRTSIYRQILSSIQPHEEVTESAEQCERNQTLEQEISSCQGCGEISANLMDQVEKMRRHLENSEMSDEDIKRELKEFLTYLEERNKSIECSDTTSDDFSLNFTNPSQTTHSTFARYLDDNDGIHVHPVYGANENNIRSRFINLDDFHTLNEIERLTVKQLKEVLMLNRVDYKGCCEKKELLDRVERLWKSLKAVPAIEKLQTNELCKICMDAPIECVILECGHMATCTNCGKVLSECPICRQYIVRVVRFFKA